MTPRRHDDTLRMSEAEFEELLARAAKEGAKRALADAGLDGKEAALDIRDLRSLLADTDVDWEAPLARMLGELPAHRIGEGGRALLRWVDQSRRHCEAALGDYLTEEQRLLPPQLEVTDFLADVDRLRADADRLEARLRLLERRRAR